MRNDDTADPRDNRETDEALLGRTVEGDETAFRELVKRHENGIINLAYRYTASADEAEDIAAEVFFRVWKNAAGFRGKSKFSTWLYRIAVNTCLNYRKSTHRAPLFEYLDALFSDDEGEYRKEIAEPDHARPDTAAQRTEQEKLVTEAVNALAPQQKMAFTLSWFKGYSYQEIAEIMELSVASVESLLFRAKENLRKRLVPTQH